MEQTSPGTTKASPATCTSCLESLPTSCAASLAAFSARTSWPLAPWVLHALRSKKHRSRCFRHYAHPASAVPSSTRRRHDWSPCRRRRTPQTANVPAPVIKNMPRPPPPLRAEKPGRRRRHRLSDDLPRRTSFLGEGPSPYEQVQTNRENGDLRAPSASSPLARRSIIQMRYAGGPVLGRRSRPRWASAEYPRLPTPRPRHVAAQDAAVEAQNDVHLAA